MLAELCGDNKALAPSLREGHGVCEVRHDIATASPLERKRQPSGNQTKT